MWCSQAPSAFGSSGWLTTDVRQGLRAPVVVEVRAGVFGRLPKASNALLQVVPVERTPAVSIREDSRAHDRVRGLERVLRFLKGLALLVECVSDIELCLFG
ncbi:MAG: hypothetical protein HC904_16935 [Blastochloris sp.]|nr:hypothetical protein [Blastochloris sp.]